ncbi:MAG: PASTA domain-containing protein [Candidatus Margulisbacteria bacterium]|nr:PASTA domain-containing protein [Candidatus Margulisiibacteriota bacterium]
MMSEPKLIRGYYEVQNCLSEGVLTRLYDTKHTVKQDRYYVWEFKAQYLSPEVTQDLIKLAQKLRYIRHPNILSLEEFEYTGSQFYAIYPFEKDLVSLGDYLNGNPDVSDAIRGKWSTQIVSAMMLLESKDLCGGQLNIHDLYIDQDQNIMLSTVSLPIPILQHQLLELDAIDEGIFIAPELVQSQTYTIQSDIYSMGILLYVLFGKQWPYPNTSKITGITTLLLEGPLPFYKRFESTPNHIEKTIQICLQIDPNYRYPSFAVLLKNLQSPKTAKPPHYIPLNQEETFRKELKQDVNRRKNKKNRKWVILTIASIIILSVLGVLYHEFVSYSTSIPEKAVPHVTGMSLERALRVLKEDGLLGEIAGERDNAQYPKGYVIESRPPEGRNVKENRRIRLFLSKGNGSDNCAIFSTENPIVATENVHPVDPDQHNSNP